MVHRSDVFFLLPSVLFLRSSQPCGALCLCLAVMLGMPLSAQEPPVFTPPQVYPASRYEAGWSKNPFTLKTTAPVNAQDSFARDLAIGAHYGAADNPTVVIVNTKTSERILLRRDQPAPGGLRLKSVHLGSNRKECQVEVALGSETAVLAYNSSYLSQLAAAETSRMAATKKPASSPATGLQLPNAPAPKSDTPAQPTFKVSSWGAPAPVTPAAPESKPRTRPVLPLPAPAAQ